MNPPLDPSLIGSSNRVAALMPAEQAFARRRLIVPIHCGALLSGDEGARVVRAGEEIPREGARELLIFATGPLRLAAKLDSLASSDGWDFQADVELEATIIPEKPELLALRRAAFSAPGYLTTDQIAACVRPLLLTALASFAKQSPAADLVRSDASTPAADGILRALQPELFALGLSLVRVTRVEFRSPAFTTDQRDRQRDALLKRHAETDAQIRESLTAIRRKQMAGVEDLLQRLAALARENPGMPMPDLIRMFDPEQRGDLYRGLLSAQPATKTAFILAVAGQELLWFAPDRPGDPVRRVALPAEAGPLRSIRVARTGDSPLLLVGAAHGVHRLTLEGEPVLSHTFEPPRPVRGGVNSAAIAADRLFATHSEVGLIAWPLSAGDKPDFPLPGEMTNARTIRDVQSDQDGRLWFAVADSVLAWYPSDTAPPIRRRLPGIVECLALTRSFAIAGLDDGRVLQWSRIAPDRGEARAIRPPTGDAVHSIGVLESSGVPRVLIADGRPMADLVVIDDAHRIEFRAPEPLRWAWAAEDCIVAANERRDRLFLWSIATPDEPSATFPIGRLTGHTIQDALLVAATPATIV